MKRVPKMNKQEYIKKSGKELREKRETLPKEKLLMTEEYFYLSPEPASFQYSIRSILNRLLSTWSGKLGEINTTEHSIDLKPGSIPVAVTPYGTGTKTRELEHPEIYRQLRDGVIEPETSEWAFPVVFFPKADGTLRCVS